MIVSFLNFFLHGRVSSCHTVTPVPLDTNSLLAFVTYFLTHTASSICQCQVTMLINRSVLAAAKMHSDVVARIMSGLWHAFPPTEPLASDVVASATYEDKNSPSVFVMDISSVHI